jgi:hypothetical protein
VEYCPEVFTTYGGLYAVRKIDTFTFINMEKQRDAMVVVSTGTIVSCISFLVWTVGQCSMLLNETNINLTFFLYASQANYAMMSEKQAAQELEFNRQRQAVLKAAVEKARAATSSPEYLAGKAGVEQLLNEGKALDSSRKAIVEPIVIREDSSRGMSPRIPAFRGEPNQQC